MHQPQVARQRRLLLTDILSVGDERWKFAEFSACHTVEVEDVATIVLNLSQYCHTRYLGMYCLSTAASLEHSLDIIRKNFLAVLIDDTLMRLDNTTV